MNWSSHEFIWLDWAILAIGLCGVVAAVWYAIWKDKKAQQGEDSSAYLFGKGEPWYVIGMAIFAANIGSEHLVGLAGTGAKDGVGMAHWEMQGWMILILGWLFVPFYQLLINKMGKIITMPDFLKFRYTQRTGSWLSIITLVAYVLTKVSVTAFTGGIFFEYLLGLNFWVGAIGLIAVTAVFTVFGGMKGVMTLSSIQTPILIIGSFLVLFLGLATLGGGSITEGWTMMMDTARSMHDGYGINHMFHTDPGDPMYAEYPGYVVFLGACIIGFWYWCTDQYIVQRVLSGKNEKEARRGTIFGAYLKLLPVFLFLIPGMIAFAMSTKGVTLPNGEVFVLSTPDAAFPTLVAKLLPAGVKGLVVCGILAALMSSLASLFNSSAMLFTIDFWKRLKPETPEKQLVRIGQIATVVIVILGILWIPIMRSVGDVLYNYLQDVQSVLAPGIASAFLLGICWKRASAKGGMWGLLSGIIIGLTRLGAKVYYSNATDAADSWFKAVFYDFNWLFFCGAMLVVCCLVVIVVSLITEAPDEKKIQGLVFGTSTPEQVAATRASWNKWDVIHTVIILGFTAAFYYYFW